MRYLKISLVILGELKVAIIILFVLFVLGWGLLTSTCLLAGPALRVCLSWFLGNGSLSDTPTWPKLVCCSCVALLGYVFLGLVLHLIVALLKAGSKPTPRRPQIKEAWSFKRSSS